MAQEFVKFLQFGKVTEDADGNVIVWGIATQEKPDLDGEICMYAAAKPVYEEWSEAAAQRTSNAGQEISYGPIRLQHSIEMGGKATKLEFDDDAREIRLGSVPLNDQIRDDLRAGFYTGYSQGGSYAWRKCAECDHNLPLQQANNYCPKCKKNVQVEYGLKRLSEVSYVDSPCSGVGFDYVKANGSREFVKFSKRSMLMDLTKEQIEQIATQVRKGDAKTKRVAGEDLPHDHFAFVGDPEKTETWKLPIKFSTEGKTKRHIRNALARFESTKGIPDDKKDEVKAKIVAAAKEHGIEVSESGKAVASPEAVAYVKARVAEKIPSEDVTKSLWDVARFADILQSLACLYDCALWERDSEGDDSPIPDDLLEHLHSMIDTFIAMAEEEAKELAARKADTTKKEGTMSEPNEDLIKAAKKSLAHHFAKSAAHHEKLAAHHEKAAASHEEMCDACKAMHKADVSEGAEHTSVGSVPFYKAASKHHAEKAAHHEKMAKAHTAHAEHLAKMAESHDKEESEKALKEARAAEPVETPAPVVKTPAIPASIDADVDAAKAAHRNSPEYKQQVADLAKAELEAELKKLRSETVIPDGVKLTDFAKGVTFVPRGGADKFEFAAAELEGNSAGL